MRIKKINKLQKAIWNDSVIAESETTLTVDGYTYFPPESVNKELLIQSDHHSFCPWKGTASYYSLKVKNETNKNAAWYYPQPFQEAAELKNWIGFWKGVEIKSE